jgi:microcystin-dependent protein
MATPFIGQIKCFAFNFAPRNWAFTNGQLLPIAQNQALFALLGTTYGGNGQTNFALPDLRDRTPLHFGNNAFGNFPQGSVGGEVNHTLTPTVWLRHRPPRRLRQSARKTPCLQSPHISLTAAARCRRPQ